MRALKRHIILYFILFLLALNVTYAKTNCVFDNTIFSESSFKNNSTISSYVWNNEEKSVKGITNTGNLFAIKYWSCEHYGIHASLILGPYPDGNIEILNKLFIKLANIALPNGERKILSKWLKSNKIKLISDSGKHIINTTEFSEFYLAYNIVNEIIILEIKLYRD